MQLWQAGTPALSLLGLTESLNVGTKTIAAPPTMVAAQTHSSSGRRWRSNTDCTAATPMTVKSSTSWTAGQRAK